MSRPGPAELSSAAAETMRRWVPAPSSVAGRELRSTGKVPGRRRRAPQWAGRAPEKKRREPQPEGRVPRRTGKAPPLTERTSLRTGRAPRRLSGPCPGTGALRLRRIPPHPTRVASAEQENAGSRAADAEPLGGLASPAERAARPTRPQTPAVVHSGRTGSSGARKGAGDRAAPHRARPAAPSPCHSPGPGGPLGIIPSRARRGRARRGSRARRRKGRATMCRGGGGRRREPLARSRSAAAGADCRKSKHFGRKSES